MDYSIPVSGLKLQSLRVSVSANNIVNAGSLDSGRLPEKVPFTPSAVDAVSTEPGVRGSVYQLTTNTPLSATGQASDFLQVFSSTGVNIEEELVNQKLAVTAYKANAAVIRTFTELDDALLEIGTRDTK
ncbi:flagellar basal body rod C-terminal domain-containing protein [Kiloniella laminariae]|uniref:flagellar basal body rod C-terminal domain-containing protein n=1 Tax=Kiloniella laminariae TaxID=454162 RepID=UPI0003700C69|nr:flagellar basal body rod C-terminal domain-containing protein [Kiloniella laminariae]